MTTVASVLTERVIVCNPSSNDAEQNGMINRVKKLSHIALQYPARLRSILTLGPQHIAYAFDAFVRALANAAGERGRNKGRLKNRIDNPKNRVVQSSVSHGRLVYPAAFRIVYPKAVVGAVLVRFVAQLASQLKDMLLDFLLKLGNIRLVPLVAFEYFPCRKKVLCGNY